ncbi:glycosyltransferase [Ruficoccus amylovorans]|uniref:Glycosyltransferase n=1 Tax=Ruficoccus amylovorans TaxID=1804625 RepID=A0A842HF21_9BACT|nr:glycosyltransferase [Ruficoccus amylovorans]MBC2595123.1 glycosyltransferase [Ruficoccus amylovorans]
MPRPRILIIGPSHPFRGGIAAYSTLLYDTLRKRTAVDFFGYRRQFWKWLYPGRSQLEPGRVNMARKGIEYCLDTYNPFSWLRAGRRARDYDAVVLPWWVVFWVPFYALFLWASRGGAVRVLLCHNVQDHETGLLTRLGARFIFNRADAFVVQSEAEAARLRAVLSHPHPVAVHGHPSYAFYNSGEWTREAAREHLGLDRRDRVALFFGYVRGYKGVDVLLRAMGRLKSDNVPLRLLVVGEIWKDDPVYRQLADELGLGDRVEFVDRYVGIEEIEPYFKAADVSVLPYRSATGSGVLQLAFGMGTPVVASDLPAFSEAMTDGREGLLVPPGDEVALAAALRRVFGDNLLPAMRVELAALPPDASWEALADKLEALIAEARATR